MPCADEVWRLQNRPGKDCEMFKAFADKGHYAGRGGTRQGIYAATPAGELLASINSNAADRVAGMMKDALKKWAKVPQKQRYLKTDPRTETINRRNAKYPKDGLVLQVITRDLPRDKKLSGWKGEAWNYDYAWYRKDEAREWLPPDSQLAKGARHKVPQELVERLVRFHLLDNVRGQTTTYDKLSVQTAELTTTIKSGKRGVAEVTFAGKTAAEKDGRGVSLTLMGKGKFDFKTGRFKAFELVGVGQRWGATQFNFRQGDTDKQGIGFHLRLSGDKPQERVAPEHFHGYGWN